MRFRAEIEGREVVADIYSGGSGAVEFRCDDLPTKIYKDLDAVERAIKAYNLSLRKGFENPPAVHVRRYGGESKTVTSVEVVSICDGGEEAWARVLATGKREKLRLSDLYTYAEEVAVAAKREADLHRLIADAWVLPVKWAPRWPGSIEAAAPDAKPSPSELPGHRLATGGGA